MEDVNTAVVPVEPTEAMVEAGQSSIHARNRPSAALLRVAYRAMLAAAPAPLPGGLEDVAQIREKVAEAVLDACRQYADTIKGYVGERRAVHIDYILCDATNAILAILGSRPSSPGVPTEQAEGAVVGDGPLSDLVLVKAPIRPTAEMIAAANAMADSKGHFRQGAEQVWRDMMSAWIAIQPAPTPASVSPGTSAASAPNLDAGVVGDLVEDLLKEAGHVCDPHVRCPVSVVRGERIPGPPVGPPPYCVLPAGHEGPHRSQHGGPLRGETEMLDLPQRCLKCRQPWPCETAALATQGTGEWRHIATAPRDGSEFEARCGEYAPFSCEWDGERFVHYDPDDGPIAYAPDLWRPTTRKGAVRRSALATHQPAISTDIGPFSQEAKIPGDTTADGAADHEGAGE